MGSHDLMKPPQISLEKIVALEPASGTTDLENHLNYLHEVRAEDHLAIFSRLVAHSAKRMQYLMFMVDETSPCFAAFGIGNDEAHDDQ